LALPSREIHWVTSGSDSEGHPTLSSDARRLIYTTARTEYRIVLADLRSKTLEPCDLPSSRTESQVALAPDGGEMAFVDSRGSPFDIWIQPIVNRRAEGPPRRLATQSGTASHPAFSPDGRWVAYYVISEEEKRDIWTVPVASGLPVRFTDDGMENTEP